MGNRGYVTEVSKTGTRELMRGVGRDDVMSMMDDEWLAPDSSWGGGIWATWGDDTIAGKPGACTASTGEVAAHDKLTYYQKESQDH